jgi:hypothetical protein
MLRVSIPSAWEEGAWNRLGRTLRVDSRLQLPARGHRSGMRPRSFACLPVLASLCSPTAAQAPALTEPVPVITREHLRVPLHRPHGTSDRWAAAGADYKAVFGDGFAFHPRMGRDRAGVVWRWRTVSVEAGGRQLGGGGPAAVHAAGDWRFEYRHGDVIEAYDVRPGGVEQTFTILRRPERPADVVVTGRIETSLQAPATEAVHGDLTFADAGGTPLVRYGAAFAVDAAGARTPLPASWDGGSLRLRVAAEWLARATFPVTIDPLTAAVQIVPLRAVSADHMDVARDGESATHGVLAVFYLFFSVTDADVYGYLMNDDFGDPRLVFYRSLPGTVWMTSVAFVGGADRWLVGFEHYDAGQWFVYGHAKGNLSLNSGSTLALPTPPNSSSIFHLDIGGTAGGSAGTHGLLVLGTRGRTSSYAAACIRLDAATMTLGAPFGVAPPSPVITWPAVNQVSAGGSSSWIVAWQQDLGGRELHAARVTANGAVAGSAALSRNLVGETFSPGQAVSGRDGRYLVAHRIDNSLGFAKGIRLLRFDWGENDPAPGAVTRIVHDDARGSETLNDLHLAYDHVTGSHWALACKRLSPAGFELPIRRLGGGGGTVEAQNLASGPTGNPLAASAVAFDATHHRFLAVYTALFPMTNEALYGRHFTYSGQAQLVALGAGCGPSIVQAPAPYAGSQFFGVSLVNGAPNAPAVSILAGRPGTFDLTSLGATGCIVRLDPASLLSFGNRTDARGSARMPLPLPDRPPFLGDVYFQWAYLSPGANPLGLQFSPGVRIQVR